MPWRGVRIHPDFRRGERVSEGWRVRKRGEGERLLLRLEGRVRIDGKLERVLGTRTCIHQSWPR